MRGRRFLGTAISLVALLLASRAYSQDGVYWHMDPGVKSCSMVIDPSLTQSQWERYTRQIGAIATFKSLASAEPLGKLNFALGIDYSTTPIDQRDPAWINTFTHPDESCPLGDQIVVPTLRARLGVSSRVDVGGTWTTAPRANYGLLGGEVKYAFLKETGNVPAAAVTTSFTMLTGVPDYNINVYSVGLLASKRFSRFAPYLGVKEALAVGTETTDKVNLERESIAFTQGFIGATYFVWKLGLSAEYDIAEVNSLVFVVGVH